MNTVIDIDPALAQEIEFWCGYGVNVVWHIHPEGTRAIGIGDGFAWSIEIDADGSVYAAETSLGAWSTGFDI